MPEILTESFCERCGTRYTFESAAPRVAKLKGIKVLSRGLKNFVMSDDTSMDEAMAAARSETDRELTAHQLDAFHKTFNFCMSCRQYTCGNCWNEVEGRCLSCAPNLGHEILPAPFPDLDPAAALTASPTNGTNGHTHDSGAPLAWPSMDLERDLESEAAVEDDLSDLEPIDAAARLAALGATDAESASAATVQTEEPVADAAVEDQPGVQLDLDAANLEAEAGTEAADALAPSDPAELVVTAETEDAQPGADEVASAAADEPAASAADADVIAAAPSGPASIDAADVPGRASAAAAQTNALLRRFRPGQSLDAELEAYEREQETEAAAAVAPVVPPGAEQPDLAAPASTEATESAPPTEAAPPTEPEPVREDVVSQPTWRIVAPDTTDAPSPATMPAPEAPTSAPRAAASAEPQWPSQPEWPSHRPGSAGLPFLDRPAQPTGGLEALWAESAREVVSAPAPLTLGSAPAARPAPGGVQPCVSCGLSLSATARFCRRCGTRQD